MGAFGVHVFEEDMACDTLARAVNHMEEPFVEILKDLEDAIDSDYLEIDECGAALTYTVLLLGLKDINIINVMSDQELGKPYRENVLEFVEKHKQVWRTVDQQKFLNTAEKALDAVLSDKSESLELWRETEYLDDWLEVVKSLQSKLQAQDH
jgi:hypothetical protein